MQRNVNPSRSSLQRRVLARVLAEELQVVRGGLEPVEVTGPKPDGHRDITNVSDDHVV